MAIADDAARLDDAIARLQPDAALAPAMQVALADAAALATAIADAARADAPPLAALADTIARACTLVAGGEVEPHHMQWLSAAAVHAMRQAIAAGADYAAVALAGAQYELETLFPLPGGVRAGGSLPETAVVPATNLVRRLT